MVSHDAITSLRQNGDTSIPQYDRLIEGSDIPPRKGVPLTNSTTRPWLNRLVGSVLTVALLLVVGLYGAQPASAAPTRQLTAHQLEKLAQREYAAMSDSQRLQVTHIARYIQNGKAPESVRTGLASLQASSPANLPGPRTRRPGVVQTQAVPLIVWEIAVLILRYGVPWVIRYAGNLWNAMQTSYAIRWTVCNLLRSWGNGWGWSWACYGT